MKIVIFGYGNPSRGDDGIGPFLLHRIEDNYPHFECIEDFQLQLEHAIDLQGHDLALFIDAGTNTNSPFSFYQIEATQNITHTSHALLPQNVLGVFSKVTGQVPPPAFVLCVAGNSFELGQEISTKAMKNTEAAWEFLNEILAKPNIGNWQSKILQQEI